MTHIEISKKAPPRLTVDQASSRLKAKRIVIDKRFQKRRGGNPEIVAILQILQVPIYEPLTNRGFQRIVAKSANSR